MTFVPTVPARRDALVEYATYTDDGCEVSAHCLDCPLERCRYDERPDTAERPNQNRVAALELLAQGLPVRRVAAALGISRRSVFRYQAGK